MGNNARSKLRTANGQPRPKGKPRGISALRLKDPSLPDPLAPYRWKPGVAQNPRGQSRKQRLSDALIEELSLVDPAVQKTKAAVVASNLIQRAEVSSDELKLVLNITEPGLLQDSSVAGHPQNIVIVERFGDKPVEAGEKRVGSNGHQPGRALE